MGLLAPLLAFVALASSGSPSAEVIALSGVRWSGDQQRATASIYTMRSDGSQRRRLTGKGGWTDTEPSWSPDAKQLAFGRLDARGWRILVMPATGGRPRPLISSRSLAEAPTWSADGRSIAFAGLPAKLPATGSVAQQIYRVGVSGAGLRRLTSFKAGAGSPAWSPDGRRIAFVAWTSLADNARADIWTMRPSGRGVHRLVRNATDPAWSPDGRRVAFARDGEIYVVAIASGTVRKITSTPRSDDSNPSWCDDGKRLAFASVRHAADPANDDMVISTINPDGGGLRTIRDGDPSFWADAPAWRPVR